MTAAAVGQRVRYSMARYAILDHVRDALGVRDLHRLHAFDAGHANLVTRETDQQTPWHAKFYAAFDGPIGDGYRTFLREVVLPLHASGVVYQRVPTFRVQYPMNLAVGEFHKDSDYSHVEQAENWYLPLTRAYGTATIWAESEPDKGDYAPLDAEVGLAVRWDGIHLRHGNKPNETGLTRVSLDFRVIPAARFVPQPERRSINTGKAFVLGDYYEAMER